MNKKKDIHHYIQLIYNKEPVRIIYFQSKNTTACLYKFKKNDLVVLKDKYGDIKTAITGFIKDNFEIGCMEIFEDEGLFIIPHNDESAAIVSTSKDPWFFINGKKKTQIEFEKILIKKKIINKIKNL